MHIDVPHPCRVVRFPLQRKNWWEATNFSRGLSCGLLVKIWESLHEANLTLPSSVMGSRHNLRLLRLFKINIKSFEICGLQIHQQFWRIRLYIDCLFIKPLPQDFLLLHIVLGALLHKLRYSWRKSELRDGGIALKNRLMGLVNICRSNRRFELWLEDRRRFYCNDQTFIALLAQLILPAALSSVWVGEWRLWLWVAWPYTHLTFDSSFVTLVYFQSWIIEVGWVHLGWVFQLALPLDGAHHPTCSFVFVLNLVSGSA